MRRKKMPFAIRDRKNVDKISIKWIIIINLIYSEFHRKGPLKMNRNGIH